jgi:hypothetical protein
MTLSRFKQHVEQAQARICAQHRECPGMLPTLIHSGYAFLTNCCCLTLVAWLAFLTSYVMYLTNASTLPKLLTHVWHTKLPIVKETLVQQLFKIVSPVKAAFQAMQECSKCEARDVFASKIS